MAPSLRLRNLRFIATCCSDLHATSLCRSVSVTNASACGTLQTLPCPPRREGFCQAPGPRGMTSVMALQGLGKCVPMIGLADHQKQKYKATFAKVPGPGPPWCPFVRFKVSNLLAPKVRHCIAWPLLPRRVLHKPMQHKEAWCSRCREIWSLEVLCNPVQSNTRSICPSFDRVLSLPLTLRSL